MSDEPKIAYLMQEIRANKTILNLIEKLQKENKELKEYIAIAPNLDEMTATKYIYIRQDGYIQGRVEEQQKAKQIINENYISKEKIEDKVRELECYIQENSDEQGYWGNRNPDVIYGQIEILQELLEESEEN